MGTASSRKKRHIIDLNYMSIASNRKYSVNYDDKLGRGSFGYVYGLYNYPERVVKIESLPSKHSRASWENQLKMYKKAAAAGIGPRIYDVFDHPVQIIRHELDGHKKPFYRGYIVMQRCLQFSEEYADWDVIDDQIDILVSISMYCYDLKPENMLVEPFTDKPLITDYGDSFCSVDRHMNSHSKSVHAFLMKVTLYTVSAMEKRYRRGLKGPMRSRFVSTNMQIPVDAMKKATERIRHYTRLDEDILYERIQVLWTHRDSLVREEIIRTMYL